MAGQRGNLVTVEDRLCWKLWDVDNRKDIFNRAMVSISDDLAFSFDNHNDTGDHRLSLAHAIRQEEVYVQGVLAWLPQTR